MSHRAFIGGVDRLVASEPVRLYLEPGVIVTVRFTRAGADGEATATIVLSGHLVDVP